MMVFAASLSVKESATQIIIMNATSLCFMAPLGLQIAGSVLVGNKIGKGNVPSAKKYAKFVNALGIVMGLALAFILMVFSMPISSFYTNIESVRDAASGLFNYIALFIFIDVQ